MDLVKRLCLRISIMTHQYISEDSGSDQSWLVSSLFCAASEWPELLNEAIKPFMDLSIVENTIDSFRIEMNYMNGENVRLALHTVNNNSASLALQTDSYFKNYFSKRKHEPYELSLPLKGIFMPFPINSIQYGLYRIKPTEKEEIDIMKELSLIIVDFFKEEIPADETILLFAFHLHICCFKITSTFTKHAANIADLYRLPPLEEMAAVKEFAEEKFSENEITLLQVVEDIFYDSIAENESLKWLNKWELLCDQWVKQWIKSGKYSANNIVEIHKKIFFQINNQLAINGDMLFLLFCFVNRSMEKFSNRTSNR